MAEKKIIPGKTTYLEPGEKFDQVASNVVPIELPPTIQLGPNGERTEVKPEDNYQPIKAKGSVAAEAAALGLVDDVNPQPEIEEKPIIDEEPVIDEKEEVARKTVTLAKKMLDKAKLEPKAAKKEPEEEPEEYIPPVRKQAQFIDLNNINVINKSELDKERDLRNALYGGGASYQIIAAQSGYTAKMLPLVHKDILNILQDKVSRFEYQKGLYRIIFDKISGTSVGKFTFEEWLRNTSVEDTETLYYGIYASTFPNEGSFMYTCPACEAEREYAVNHRNLITTTDNDAMKERIQEVSLKATTMEKMKEFSLIGKNDAIQLSKSNIIFDLRTPALLDLLEILRTVPEQIIQKSSESIVYMLYVNKVLIPVKEGNGYFEEYKKERILEIIEELHIDDAVDFKDAVDNRIEDKRISYSIKNIKCMECDHEVKEIPLSIENVLFTLIFEKTQ